MEIINTEALESGDSSDYRPFLTPLAKLSRHPIANIGRHSATDGFRRRSIFAGLAAEDAREPCSRRAVHDGERPTDS
jgi:hypothetical protein